MHALTAILVITALARDPSATPVPPQHMVLADGLWLGETDGPELDSPWSTGLVWTYRLTDAWRVGASLRYAGEASAGSTFGHQGGYVESRGSVFRAWPVRPGGVVELVPTQSVPGLHLGTELSARGGVYRQSNGLIHVDSSTTPFYQDPAPGLFAEASVYSGYRHTGARGLTFGLDGGIRFRGFAAFDQASSRLDPTRLFAGASLGYAWTPGASPPRPTRPPWSTRKKALVWGSIAAVVIPAAALTLRTCGPVFYCERVR